MEDFTGAAPSGEGKKFKIDPQRLLYSLQWSTTQRRRDFELVLVKNGPAGWVNTANLTLLGELRRRVPHAIDWVQLAAAGFVSQLDAFEAAREALARRH